MNDSVLGRTTAWPPGDGEMATCIRAHDWAATSLGPIGDWPQSLRTAVDMMLAMPGPASIVWGPEHVRLYNDAYVAIAWDRHPALLGRPAAESWPEGHAGILAPVMEAACTGRATRIADLSVHLQGAKDRLENQAFDTTWSPIRDEAGAVGGALEILVEVTDRHRAEASLRENETRHRLLIESWAQAVWETDAKGLVIADSPSWRAYTGQSLEEWLGYGWLDAIHPDDRAYAERQWREAIAAHGRINAEFRLRAPDGGWRWTNVRAAPVLDAGGRIEKWAGMNIDIDARKRAELALHESEQTRDLALAAAEVGTWDYDLITDVCRFHAYGQDLHSLPSARPGHCPGSDASVVHPHDTDPMTDALQHASDPAGDGRYDISYRIARDDGSYRWLRAWGKAEFKGDGTARRAVRLVGASRDVTAEKKAEDALRQSEERQAFLLKLSDILQRLTAPNDIKTAAMHMLGTHLGVSRAQYHEVDSSGAFYSADGIGYANDLPLLDLKYRIDQFGSFVAEDFEAGRPFRSDDLGIDPRPTAEEREAYGFYQIRAGAGIPLLRGGDLVAILAVHDMHPHPWTDLEMDLIRETAERVWVAVEKVRTELALRGREEQQAFLLRFTDALRVEPDQDAVVERAIRMLAEKLALDRCYVTAMYADEDRVEVTHEFRRPDLAPMPSRLHFSDFPEAGKQSLDRTLIFDDTANDPELTDTDKRSLAAMGFGALLSRPLHRGAGNPIWALGAVSSCPRHWTPSEIALIEEVAERTWALAERARAEAALSASEEKYRSLFDSIDAGFAIVEMIHDEHDEIVDMIFRQVNAAYERQGGIYDVVGRSIFEILPGVEDFWLDYYKQVAKTGQPVRVEDYQQDLSRWFDVYFSRVDKAGRFVAIVFSDISERKRAEEALRESEERYRAIVETARDYAIFTTDPEGLITAWPPGAQEVFGWRAEEAVGLPAGETFTPEDRETGEPEKELTQAREEGQAPNVRWHVRKDGCRVFINGVTRPMKDASGTLTGFLKVGQDVTKQFEMQERMRVLVAELQHRTRNLIAVVRSVADRTVASADSLDDFRGNYRARLGALARVNGLLSRLNEHDRITFDELIRTELSGHGVVLENGRDAQVTLDGPSGIRLRSSTVQTFALALHELTTNAVKYGALSSPDGHLTVAWRLIVDGEARLRVEWREEGVRMGDGNGAPARVGYGRELIEQALPFQLRAETSYELGADGVRCTITLPISTQPGEPEHE